MGISKFFQRSKDSHHGSSNADKQSSPTPGTSSPTVRPITPLSQKNPLPEDASSLWSRAYETLRNEDPQLVDRYEKLLSRELDDSADSTVAPQGMPPNGDDLDYTRNQMDYDSKKRQSQLKVITDRGLQRADEKQTKYTLFGHVFVLKEQVAQASQFIQAMKNLVNEAVKVSPEASLAWAGVCVLLPVLTNPSAAEEANRDGLSYVTFRIRYYIELERLLWPENLIKPALKTEFDGHIVDLYQHILEFQIKTVLRFYRQWLATATRDMIRYDDWEGMLFKIKEREQIIQNESGTLNTVASRNTLEDISKAAEQLYGEMRALISIAMEQLAEQRRTNQILEDRPIDLPVLYEACFDSADVQDSPKCETGTRLSIRETIHQWADDFSGEIFFWLVGPAGTGKSTIARTIADTFSGEKRLVAGYFFKRGEQGRNDTARFFPTLAKQLAQTIPSFKSCLRKSLDSLDRDVVEKKSLEAQFDKLLWLPLGDLPPTETTQPSKVIIIDALDECERPEHLSRILTLLGQLHNIKTVGFRVLFTSRPAPEIVNAFEPFTEEKTVRSLDLHREFSQDTRTDIKVFLERKFAYIRSKRRIQQDPWPAIEDLDHLVQLATNPQPLFIYAATLCRFIYDEKRPCNPKNQLKLWLKQCEDGKSQLHQIYDPILRQVFGNKEAESGQQLQVLGAMVLLATPLSAVSLAMLLGQDLDDVNWWLPELHAVLEVPPEPHHPIRLLHKSFSDFLVDPSRRDTNQFWIDERKTHQSLAKHCIRHLQSCLRKDVCNLRKPGKARLEVNAQDIETCLPVHIQYACRYWVYHLEQSKECIRDGDSICDFLTSHFLHWLEALSLMGTIAESIAMVNTLKKLVEAENPDMSCFLYHAERFLLSFISAIDVAPLQLYSSAIIFTPEKSVIRRMYDIPEWIASQPKIEYNWSPCRQTFEGDSTSVETVAFSPNGLLLASGSSGNTIKLWDIATGQCCKTIECPSWSIKIIIFSPDGSLLVSVSNDYTMLWDIVCWDKTTHPPKS